MGEGEGAAGGMGGGRGSNMGEGEGATWGGVVGMGRVAQ